MRPYGYAVALWGAASYLCYHVDGGYGNREPHDLAVTRFYTSRAVYDRLYTINSLENALREAFRSGANEAGVVVIQSDSAGRVRPCAPNKVLLWITRAYFLTALLVDALCEEEDMTDKVADSIRRGLEEALAYAEGTADVSRYGVHIPEAIDVKAIRAKLDMTQEEFAGRFGFSINTLRHWEQGRRVPEGPTRAYLLVIDRNPKAVQKALTAA
jgi:putative transcriptional regulator